MKHYISYSLLSANILVNPSAIETLTERVIKSVMDSELTPLEKKRVLESLRFHRDNNPHTESHKQALLTLLRQNRDVWRSAFEDGVMKPYPAGSSVYMTGAILAAGERDGLLYSVMRAARFDRHAWEWRYDTNAVVVVAYPVTKSHGIHKGQIYPTYDYVIAENYLNRHDAYAPQVFEGGILLRPNDIPVWLWEAGASQLEKLISGADNV